MLTGDPIPLGSEALMTKWVVVGGGVGGGVPGGVGVRVDGTGTIA